MTSYDELKDSYFKVSILDNCQVSERLLYTDKYNRKELMKEMEFWNLENEN